VASTELPAAGGLRFPGGTRWVATSALLLALLAVVLARRMTTEETPALELHRTLAAWVRVPGNPPVLAWPREGQAAVAVDGVGTIGSSGGSTPIPIASVAKVMTAYMTLKEHPLTHGQQGFTMTVSAADVAEQGQRVALGESDVPVRAGERMTEREALQALLLPSANNIAALLAVHEAGSLARFVAEMNATARRLGMTSTTYTDPSGYNAGTVSTAVDQLQLARAAMRIGSFARIVDERSAVLPVAGTVDNYNGLLGQEGYVGVKTGSDGAAGGCLMFAKRVTVGGRGATVLGVVLGQRAGPLIEAALTAARQLGNSAAAALRLETVLPAGTRVLSADNVDGQQTTALTATALEQVGWRGASFRVHVLRHGRLTRLARDEPVASVTVGGAAVARTSARARDSLSGPSLGWRLRHLL
jgi:serine-type D-Ala-D-Ala carboxypeptidase (penicillin-binding protein 5/6)